MSRPLRANTIRISEGEGVYLLLSFNDKGRHWSTWTALVLQDRELEAGSLQELGAIWLCEETERIF